MAADSLTIKIGVEGGKQAAVELQGIGKSAEKMGGALSKAGATAWSAVEGMADRFDRAAKAMGTLAKAGAVVVGPLVALATPAYAVAAALGDVSTSLNDLAKRAADAGTTASDLDTLSGALGLLTRGGVDATKLLQVLDRRLGEAKDESSGAAEAFRDLGVSVEDLAGLSGTGRIAAVATAMQGLADDQERARLSAKLFEEQGQSMAAVWRQGGDAVMRAAEQVRAAGVVLDSDAANAEGYRDAVDLLNRSLTTLRIEALTPLLPQTTEFVSLLADIAQNAANTGGLSDLASWLLDVSYGATLAARDLGVMLGILSGDKGDARARALEAQADIVEGLKAQIEAQKDVERTGAEMSRVLGVEIDTGPSAAVADLTAQLDAALEKLRQLRGEWASSRMAPPRQRPSAPGGGSRPAASPGASAQTLPGTAAVDLSPEADALEWIAGIEADQHAARVAREMERLDLIEQRRVAELSAAEAVTQAHKDAIDKQIGYTEYFVQASATLWDAVAQAVVKSTRDGSKARREALMAQFVMERVSANAQLTIDGVKAISSAASSAPYPANLVAIGLAVATAVANRIALNAVPAPNLVADAGFTSDDLRRAGFTGRQTVMMHDGETVLGPQASSDASRIADAMAQVRSRVEGSSMGGDPIVYVSIGGEQVEAVVTRMQADSIRRGDHTLPLALRDARL